MTHTFERYTAAGNTFVVMNTWEDPLSLSREEMHTLVQKACDHTAGIGSDGLILINHSGMDAAAFRMDFYNPDGSTGMLCGNGARCAVQAARDYGFIDPSPTPPLGKGRGRGEVKFEVLGAINRAELLTNGSVRVYFQDPSIIRLSVTLPLGSRGLQPTLAQETEGDALIRTERGLKPTATTSEISAGYVDLGSQHVVVFFEELRAFGESSIEEMDVTHSGSLLRWHPEFAPIGANANFVEVRKNGDEKYLRIRTFERGVEGETLACGTGCMSSAIVARLTGRIESVPVRLLTQSGEYVTVDFELDGHKITNLSLEGPVVRGETGSIMFDEQNETLKVIYD